MDYVSKLNIGPHILQRQLPHFSASRATNFNRKLREELIGIFLRH
jgi:hypothetical protein